MEPEEFDGFGDESLQVARLLKGKGAMGTRALMRPSSSARLPLPVHRSIWRGLPCYVYDRVEPCDLHKEKTR